MGNMTISMSPGPKISGIIYIMGVFHVIRNGTALSQHEKYASMTHILDFKHVYGNPLTYNNIT